MNLHTKFERPKANIFWVIASRRKSVRRRDRAESKVSPTLSGDTINFVNGTALTYNFQKNITNVKCILRHQNIIIKGYNLGQMHFLLAAALLQLLLNSAVNLHPETNNYRMQCLLLASPLKKKNLYSTQDHCRKSVISRRMKCKVNFRLCWHL